jgi:aminodeoxyfutalosine deaminase
MKILLAEYVLAVSADPIRSGGVVIDGDRIAAVGTREDLLEKFPSAASEDFGEAAILPGFVNCHSHLEITAMRGFLDSVEHDFFAWLIKLTVTRGEKLTDQDIEIAAIAGALEGARGGVTCFGDIGRYGRAGLEALKANGLRGVVFQETEFSPGDKTAAEDFEKLKDKFLALREDETPLVKMGLSPHSPYTVGPGLFRLITEYALREDLKITIHAAESAEERDLMEDGTGFFAEMHKKYGSDWQSPHCSTIEYLSNLGVLSAKPLLAHCVTVSESDIESISASGTRIAHCPKSNAKFAHGWAPLERFLDAGLPVGFGSDSVASNNSCDILEEARFAVLAARNRLGWKRFITDREAIETATLGGARALGLEDEIGTLEPGKQADLAVFSLANIAQQPVHDIHAALGFASNARDCLMTMVAGEEIYRDGESKKVDEAEIKAKMKEMAVKMVS